MKCLEHFDQQACNCGGCSETTLLHAVRKLNVSILLILLADKLKLELILLVENVLNVHNTKSFTASIYIISVVSDLIYS